MDRNRPHSVHKQHSAIGRGWSDTFGVSTPQELEAKLASSGDKLEWLGVSLSHLGVDGDRYPVRHYTDVRPAVLIDPSDPERRPRFFNQILAAHTGWRDELNAPGASVVLGDGTPMRQDMLDAMERIFLEESVSVQWRAGDVMLINNLQVMHARETFVDGEAPRRVLASLGRDPAPVMEERMANVHGEHGVGSNKAHKYAWQATGGERRTRGPPALRESKTRAKVIRGSPGVSPPAEPPRGVRPARRRRSGPSSPAPRPCSSRDDETVGGGDDGWVSGDAALSVMTFMTRMGVNKSELIERGFL